MIAVTSDFIPRLVYQIIYSCDRSLRGYVDNSLAFFNVADFLADAGPTAANVGAEPEFVNLTYCRYRYVTLTLAAFTESLALNELFALSI